ncbi:hypothetical protein NQZ68_000165 [Scomber scombrus]|uniref:Uncharacterized protein n=1 Tax=Scomber scombrus TaxID=13677 RepID=A0AAV1MXG6_SCOSC
MKITQDQCQNGQADRGKHSTGQSRGRSKGWRIDYVYVCVLNCPVSVCSCGCFRFGHTQLKVMTVCEQTSLCHPVYGQTHSRQ